MDPFHIDPFSPFPVGVPGGDPMEEVLSLQSYPSDETDSAALCISDTSVVVQCPSNVSSVKN